MPPGPTVSSTTLPSTSCWNFSVPSRTRIISECWITCSAGAGVPGFCIDWCSSTGSPVASFPCSICRRSPPFAVAVAATESIAIARAGPSVPPPAMALAGADGVSLAGAARLAGDALGGAGYSDACACASTTRVMPPLSTARTGRPTQTSRRLIFFMTAILPHPLKTRHSGQHGVFSRHSTKSRKCSQKIVSTPSLCAKAVHVAPSTQDQNSRKDAFELCSVWYTLHSWIKERRPGLQAGSFAIKEPSLLTRKGLPCLLSRLFDRIALTRKGLPIAKSFVWAELS